MVRLAAIVAALACDSSTAPAPAVSIIQPALTKLDPSLSVNGPDGFLSISASSVDRKHEFQPNERAPVEILSSGGDRETLFLRPGVCRSSPDPFILCNRIGVGMMDGYHAELLRPRLAEIDGRFDVISISGRIAGITLFSGDLDRAMRTIASWPGVKIVEKQGVILPADAYFSPGLYSVFSGLNLEVPFDPGKPISGNGRLEVQHGDLLTVTYRQPDGSTLTASYTVDLVSPVKWPLGYPVSSSQQTKLRPSLPGAFGRFAVTANGEPARARPRGDRALVRRRSQSRHRESSAADRIPATRGESSLRRARAGACSQGEARSAFPSSTGRPLFRRFPKEMRRTRPVS